MAIVDRDYVPTETTVLYLEKKHFTRQHIWSIVKKFRTNFGGQEFQNIDEKFKKVMKLEFATNAPEKKIKPFEIDLSHKSKDSEQKAAEVKEGEPMFTKAEAIEEYERRRGNFVEETYQQASKTEHHSKGGGAG